MLFHIILPHVVIIVNIIKAIFSVLGATCFNLFITSEFMFVRRET